MSLCIHLQLFCCEVDLHSCCLYNAHTASVGTGHIIIPMTITGRQERQSQACIFYTVYVHNISHDMYTHTDSIYILYII